MRYGAHVSSVSLGRFIWSEAEQPDIVVHSRRLALNEERSAQEVNQNAALLEKLDQLLSAAVDFVGNCFEQCIIGRID
jgi:hypothetical protein